MNWCTTARFSPRGARDVVTAYMHARADAAGLAGVEALGHVEIVLQAAGCGVRGSVEREGENSILHGRDASGAGRCEVLGAESSCRVCEGRRVRRWCRRGSGEDRGTVEGEISCLARLRVWLVILELSISTQLVHVPGEESAWGKLLPGKVVEVMLQTSVTEVPSRRHVPHVCGPQSHWDRCTWLHIRGARGHHALRHRRAAIAPRSFRCPWTNQDACIVLMTARRRSRDVRANGPGSRVRPPRWSQVRSGCAFVFFLWAASST